MTQEKEKYAKLKAYLNDVIETYPDDHELEDIIAIALKEDAHEANVGRNFNRTKTNPRELAFYEQWMKENEPLSYINKGHGILQDLFIESTGQLFSRKTIEVINNRDRMIVATVIQWLGSNVGMSFLHEALKRFNAHIVQEYPEKINNQEA